jgi:pimeloyl-ACP methyl ester carboxylesterase
MFHNESLEQITGDFPHWFNPRLRFFAGREDKLPVDQNQLMALVAPRGLFLYSAFSESQGGPFGFEQAYRSVLGLYERLDAADKVWLNLRDGEHPTTAGDIELFMDFLDSVFGRKHFEKREALVNGYTFEAWKRISGESIDPLRFPGRKPGEYNQGEWEKQKATIRHQIEWALGEEPAAVRFPPRTRLKEAAGSSDGWLPLLYQRPLKAPGMAYVPLSYGDDLKADFYYPESAAARRRLPLVVWLHPFSYATGYSRYTTPTFSSLTGRGLAVLAFDQIGFGSRVRDAREFYNRYPKWSLMGKMVADTRAAIDAAAALENVDPQRIYVVGYALGAKVGLLTAALDERVKALAAVDGFDPLRLDTKDKGTEGLLQYSHLHGLIPRFGFFSGYEDRLPLDFDEVLALVAPRSVMVVAPTLDRYARVDDVRAEIGQARRVYERLGAPGALTLDTPLEYSRFPRSLQERVFDWLTGAR